MHPRERFAQYVTDFDKTVEDDDWSRIERHFTDDAIREEHALPVISLRHEGLETIIDEWRKMVVNFDRRFDVRILVPTGPVHQDGNTVTMPWVGIYIIRGTPALLGEGQEIARYEGDRIKHLQTTWTAEAIQRVIDWGAQYAGGVPGLAEYTASLAAIRTTPQQTS